MHNLHGQIIDYDGIQKLPDRDSFLDKPLYKKISEDINFSKPVLFMPSFVYETNLQNKESENWKSKYCIVLYGVLMDGRRATVVIENIKPYFEVMLPENINESELASELHMLLKQHNLTSHSFEINKYKQFKGYNSNKRTFVKFYFDDLKSRVDSIKLLRGHNYETTSDDLNSYYRVVCRDYLTSFSSWVYISNYTIKTYQKIRGKVFRINMKNYNLCKEDITENPLLAKDNILSMCWDIETYSPDHELPLPDNPSHSVFMIGMTFQWHHSDDQLLRVCLVDVPSKANPYFLTIVCGTEKKLIKAFAKLFYKLKPEYILGFNDGDYDWPWIIKRGYKYKGVLKFMAENMDQTVKYTKINEKWITEYNDDDVFKYNFKKEKTKLEADAYADGYSLSFPGYMSVDVRTIFRQIYPTAEKSNLNFYLSLNKLSSKKDMPYQKIFEIYGKLKDKVNNDIKDDEYYELINIMSEISEYCIIDSQRCHELMKIRSVIMDRREIAVMSYTSMYDAFYRANGMKVRNLVIARGQQLSIRFSNITNNGFDDNGKYPGAYVFPPKKGLIVSKLSIEERINSNMPIYEEWNTVSKDELDKYYDIISNYGPVLNDNISKIQDLKKCFIDFLTEDNGRPITGLDFSSLYPSLIMAYNLSPEYIITSRKVAEEEHAKGQSLYKIKFQYGSTTVRGWSIRHNNVFEGPECKFGIYPAILKELFDLRSEMKKKLHKWESAKERLETLSKDEFNKESIQSEYSTVCFNYRYIDSKQKALKVFMNTFYGESGNKRSPFFIIQLAGAITSSGQTNIKMVQDFVEKKGCRVYYGDSVVGTTPIITKINNKINITEIQSLCNNWVPYPQFKSNTELMNKQQCIFPNGLVWSDDNWYNIIRVIRHKTTKSIYRISTDNGCVDVTEDHSLFDMYKNKKTPNELFIGDNIFHSFPDSFNERPNGIDAKSAYDIGVRLSKTLNLYDKLPIDILNSNRAIRNEFFRGLNSSKFKCKTATLAQSLYYLIMSIDLKAIVSYDEQYYIIKVKESVEPYIIRNIEYLGVTTDYVYDIEVDNGKFLGGIGSINLSNTDSIYTSMPECNFADIDKLYYSNRINKLEYWNRMVDITFKVISSINKEVNDMLYSDNGTYFLKMAFEESLYPVAFLAKKKYYGIPHISVPNFKPKDLFIRGLEVKKRGVSDMLKKVCMDIMWDSVSHLNIYTLMELVENKIKTIYTTKWDFTDFIMTDVYKPNKKNVKIHTFVERMRLEGVEVKPHERFNYVIVNKYPYRYDLRGRKVALSIGDKMEYAEMAEQKNLSINLDYYMQCSVNGQLARLVTYHPSFHPNVDEDDIKVIDDKTYNNACVYIENICSMYYMKYNVKSDVYKNIYKTTSAVLSKTFLKHYDKNIIKLINTPYDIDDVTGWLLGRADAASKKDCKLYGKRFVDFVIEKYNKSNKKKTIIWLQNVYYASKTNLLNKRENMFKKRINIVIELLNNNITKIVDILKFNEICINDMSDIIKKSLNIDNMYNEPIEKADAPISLQNLSGNMEELQNISQSKKDELLNNEELDNSMDLLRNIYDSLICNYNFINMTYSVVEYLKHLRNGSIGIKNINIDKKKLIKDSIDAILNDI